MTRATLHATRNTGTAVVTTKTEMIDAAHDIALDPQVYADVNCVKDEGNCEEVDLRVRQPAEWKSRATVTDDTNAVHLEQEGTAMVEIVPGEEVRTVDVPRGKSRRKLTVLYERSKEECAQLSRDPDKNIKPRGARGGRERKRTGRTTESRECSKRGTGIPIRSRCFRNELTPMAKKNRYGWKEDLFAIREREAAATRKQERNKPKKT